MQWTEWDVPLPEDFDTFFVPHIVRPDRKNDREFNYSWGPYSDSEMMCVLRAPDGRTAFVSVDMVTRFGVLTIEHTVDVYRRAVWDCDALYGWEVDPDDECPDDKGQLSFHRRTCTMECRPVVRLSPSLLPSDI